MSGPQNNRKTFEQLIDSLEHIEIDQLYSDIPANVHAELLRIKRNAAAIHHFVSNQKDTLLESDAGLLQAIDIIRHECMSLHLTITKVLLFHFFRLHLVMNSKYASTAVMQYQSLRIAICNLCQECAPGIAAALDSAL